jgi:hypothetical protein
MQRARGRVSFARFVPFAWFVVLATVVAPPAGARVVDLDVVPALSYVELKPTSGVYFDRPPEQGGTVFLPFATQSAGGGPTNGLRAAVTGRIRVDFRPNEGTLAIDRFRTLVSPVASGAWLPGAPGSGMLATPAQAAAAIGSPTDFATGNVALRRLAVTLGASHGLVSTGEGRWEWPDGPFGGGTPDVVELEVADGRVDFSISVPPMMAGPMSAYVREGRKSPLLLSAARRARIIDASDDQLELRLPIDVSIEEPLMDPGSQLPLRARVDLEGQLVARNFVPEPGAAAAALAALGALGWLARRRRRGGPGAGRAFALLALLAFLGGLACGPLQPGTCVNDDQCAEGENCVDNACTDDGSCNHPGDCVEGICTDGTCAPPGDPGDACDTDNDCASGDCEDGTCAGVPGVIPAGGVTAPDVISLAPAPFGLAGRNLVVVAGENGLVFLDPLGGTIPTAGNATLSFLNGFTYQNLLGAIVVKHPLGTDADAIFAYNATTGASVQSYVPDFEDFGATGLLFGTYRDAVHLGDDPEQSEALVTATSFVQRVVWTDFGSGELFPMLETALGNFTGAGVPASAFAFPALTRILVVTNGTPGKLAIGNPAVPSTAVTVVGEVGDEPRRIRCLGGICAISNFGSDSLTLATWDGGTGVAIVGTQAVGDGPIGLDLLPDGTNVVVASTGFHDSTYTLTTLAPDGSVLASETRPVPVGCDQPGHALWLGDRLVLSCFGSNALASFVPEIPAPE